MTVERVARIELACLVALVLLSISGALFVTVVATSLVWCLIVWAVFIR